MIILPEVDTKVKQQLLRSHSQGSRVVMFLLPGAGDWESEIFKPHRSV